jgi:arylsulfatase A-like enzyme
MQRYLSDAGYMTAMVGKFLNTRRVSSNPPYFHRWALTAADAPYFNPKVNLDGTVQQVPGYTTTFARKTAVSFLRSFEASDEKPWFLYLSTRAPHAPATPAARYDHAPVPAWALNPAVRETDMSDKPRWVRTQTSRSHDWIRAFRADQLRTLMSVDDLVDTVFRELGSLRERRNTLAVFLSDNGFLWGEHGLVSKRYPYTESVNVPFLLRWPGRITPGSTDSRFATNVDVAPTILAAAGVAPATPMDGRDLLADWRRPHLFTEYWTAGDFEDIPGWDSIRTRRVHYIRHYNADRSRVVFREYYRLRTDPGELRNLFRDGIATNNPNTDWLNRLIRRYRSCVGETCP